MLKIKFLFLIAVSVLVVNACKEPNIQSNMSKEIINSEGAPAPIGPYNQCIKAGDFLYLSGQIAINPESGELQTQNIQDETRQIMQNLGAVLKEAGLDYEKIVKCTIFLNDLDDFSSVNEIYGSYFEKETAPARECVEVSRLPKNVNVEISAIAYDD